MLNVSDGFKQQMENDQRCFLPYAEITLSDDTSLGQLGPGDIWEGGLKISDGVTDTGEFSIGGCITNKLTLILNNIDGKFNSYDFEGATVTAYVGLELSDGSVEKLQKGVFTVDEQTDSSGIITLECLDNMNRLEEDYAGVATSYPATLGTIVRDLCAACNVPLLTSTFDGSTTVINSRPGGDMTCRQVLSYAAQRACKFARCNNKGQMVLDWFGDSVDGAITAHFISSMDVSKADVTITGIEVTEEFEETEEDTAGTYLCGTADYVLSISGNPLIGKGAGNTAASEIGAKVNGLTFRIMDGTFWGDPSIEAGDVLNITDEKDSTYKVLATNLTFCTDGYMNLSCDAEAPSRKKSRKYSQLAQTVAKIRSESRKRMTSYELGVQQLSQLAANTLGYYSTTVRQSDGSTITYCHDKPTLAESKVVYKRGIDGFFVTKEYTGDDSTTTWTSGFDSDGNAVMNILDEVGLSADWIDTGALRVKDSDGNEIFTADMDTGEVYINGDCVTIGDKTAPDAIAEALEKANKATTITMILSNEYEGIPTDADGTYNGTMSVQTEVQVLYGNTDVTADCTYTVAKSDSVTGSWDKTAKTYTITALSSDSGWVDITATYLTSMTVTKRFSVSKVKAGTDGTTITGTTVEYQIGDSGKNVPEGTWTTKPPNAEEGKYLWTRTIIAYNNREDTTSYSVSYFGRNGEKGSTGPQGIQGLKGDDGTTYYTWLKYADTPTSGMSDSPTGKTYIGLAMNKTIATESTNYSDYQWSLIKGEKGDQGIQGEPGADGAATYTWIKYAIDENGTEMSDLPIITLVDTVCDTTGDPILDIAGNPIYGTLHGTTVEATYIGIAYNKATETKSNDPADYIWSKIKGENGQDGNGISNTEITYQASESGTIPPTGIWGTSIPEVAAGNFFWTRTITSYTDGTSTTAYSVGMMGQTGLQGLQGEKGEQGIQGEPGVDGKTSYFHIKYSAVASPTSSSQMTETPSTYIGTYVDFMEADSTDPSKYKWSRFEGIQGEKGEQGIPGVGVDGKTSYLHIAYATSADGKTGFSVSDSTGKTYIGQYTDFTETDSTDPTKYSWTKIKGDKGEDGQPTYTWIRYAMDADGTGMCDNPNGNSFLKDTAGNQILDTTGNPIEGSCGSSLIKYIGIAYNKTTAIGSDDPADYEWVKLSGDDAYTYNLSLSASVVKRGKDNVVSPASITASALYRKGSSAEQYEYPGRFKAETSADGVTWTPAYTSSADEQSCTYSLSGLDTSIEHVRFTLYESGGTSNALDMQSVAILLDVDNLTQSDIVNIISNNGEQDILKSINGKLYINGTFVQTRGLRALDEDGNITFYVDPETGEVTINASELMISDAAVATQSYASNQAQSKASSALTNAKDYADETISNKMTQSNIFNALTNNGIAKGIWIKDGQLFFSFNYAQGGTLKLGGKNNGNGKLNVLSASGKDLLYTDNTGMNICDADGVPAIRLSGRKIIFFFTYKKNSDGSETFTGVRLSKDGVAYTDDSLDGGTVTDDGEIEISFEIDENDEEDADIELE